MPYRLISILLLFGAVLGFAWGFHSLRHHHGHSWSWNRHHPGRGRAALEEHVADVCSRAAEKVYRERSAAATLRTP